jgi:tetratricopeptide (TPR) repeat protein
LPPLAHGRIDFRLFEQLKQRNVFRVAVLYLVVCWLILDPLHVVLGAADLPARAPVVSPEAYNLYLRALAARDRYDIQGQEDALSYYGQALKVDPTFVPAAVGLAIVAGNVFNYTRTEADATEARAAVDSALRLDPNLAGGAINGDFFDYPLVALPQAPTVPSRRRRVAGGLGLTGARGSNHYQKRSSRPPAST